MLKKLWMIVAPVGVAIACYISNAPLLITVASLIGVTFVLGVTYKKAWAGIAGVALSLIYGYLSYEAGFMVNAFINLIVLVPLQTIASYYWYKTDGETFGLVESKKKFVALSTIIAMTIAVGSAFYFNSHMPIHDGISGVLLVVGTLLLMFKVKEQWYAWIPYNAIEVIMWFTAMSLAPELLAIFAMRVIFFINSLFGFYEWVVRKS